MVWDRILGCCFRNLASRVMGLQLVSEFEDQGL